MIVVGFWIIAAIAGGLTFASIGAGYCGDAQKRAFTNQGRYSADKICFIADRDHQQVIRQ